MINDRIGGELTIVIPYHNREALLGRTLASVARSTVSPNALILVDNGSSDGSASICERFAQQHPELHVVLLSEPTPGASAARNRGLQAVETEWVCFFDSDDELDERFIEETQAHLSADLDLLAVPTRMMVEGRAVERRFRTTDDPVAQLLISHLNTQGMLFRTAFLRHIGGWNTQALVWNDWELGLRALLCGARMRWLASRAYHKIYVHSQSLTGANFSQRGEERLQALRLAGDAINRSTTIDDFQRHSLWRALHMRHAILAGIFRHEGNRALAEACDEQASRLATKASMLTYKVIRYLSARRLPGTWYVAYLLC